MAEINSKVFLFGPTGVGKSVMFNAIKHTLATHINDYFDGHEMAIRIDVEPKEDYAKRPRPSGGQIPFKLQFERKWVRETPAQEISAHSHNTTIHDDKGSLFHAAGSEKIRNLDELMDVHRKIYAAWKQLIDEAHGILVLLDASRIKGNALGEVDLSREDDDSVDGGHSDKARLRYDGSDVNDPEVAEIIEDIENMALLSAVEIQRMLRRLHELPDKIKLAFRVKSQGMEETITIEIPRKIAICISKADLLGDMELLEATSVERIINEQFDPGTLLAISKLREKFGETNVEVFLVSSTGFTVRGTSAAEKDDKSRNVVKDVRNWRPYNVFSPFFWVFQRLEEDVVEYLHPKKSGLGVFTAGVSLRDYIKYPLDK